MAKNGQVANKIIEIIMLSTVLYIKKLNHFVFFTHYRNVYEFENHINSLGRMNLEYKYFHVFEI
jgi:hypothetical protein